MDEFGYDEYDDDVDPEVYYVDCPECGGEYDSRTGYGCACKDD